MKGNIGLMHNGLRLLNIIVKRHTKNHWNIYLLAQ